MTKTKATEVKTNDYTPSKWSDLSTIHQVALVIASIVTILVLIVLLRMLWVVFDEPVTAILEWFEQFESPSN